MGDNSAHSNRYPGTFPFADTELDRKIFFGRETEADELLSLVLADSLVVAYGMSGVGKTSLLQAEIFQKLRDRDLLPLSVRLTGRAEKQVVPLLEVCWAAIEESCAEQKVKITSADRSGLWEFFKTAIFLKHAEPQEPVLVFDQFENIFETYDRESWRGFARQLAELFGRTPPDRIRERERAGEELLYSDDPPSVKVILCIREDRLGTLQEFAEYLPGILRDRFRLVALQRHEAQRAIVEPARAKGAAYRTPLFEFDDDAVTEILNFLAGDTNQVEPLALQVLCSAIERKVANGELGPVIKSPDLGGSAGLEKMLQDFYDQAITSLPIGWRRKVRKFLADALVSPDRRRLLVHGESLVKKYRVLGTILDRLDSRHVLRDVEHLGSSYYELSCDVLVPPVIKARPWRGWEIAKWITVGAIGGAGVLAVVFYVSLNQVADDYENINQQVTEFIGKLKDQATSVWRSPSSAVDETRQAILDLEDDYVGALPSQLGYTRHGEGVNRKIRVQSAWNKGQALSLKLTNLYEWKGEVSKDPYDKAIATISEAIALSLGVQIDKALELEKQNSDDVWRNVSELLMKNPLSSNDDTSKMASDLSDAYESSGIISMVTRSDYDKAEKDLRRAKVVAEKLPADVPDYRQNLLSIEMDLADLQIARGRVSLALQNYERVQHDLEEIKRSGSAAFDYATEYKLGALRERMSDAYLENMELGRAKDLLQGGKENYKNYFDRQKDTFSKIPDVYFGSLSGDSWSLSTIFERNLTGQMLSFDDRFTQIALAGYDQASSILAHQKARMHASQSLSSQVPDGGDWSQVVSLEFSNETAMKGRKALDSECESMQKLADHESIYRYRLSLAECEAALGVAMAANGDPDAENTFQKAITSTAELDEKVNGAEGSAHKNSEIQGVLVTLQIELGNFYLKAGLFDKAKAQYLSAKPIAEYWTKTAPDSADWQAILAWINDGLGDVYLSSGELDKASGAYKITLDIRSALTEPDTTSGARLLGLAVSEYKLASLEELAGGGPKAAENHRARAVEILKRLDGEQRLPPIAKAWPAVFARAR